MLKNSAALRIISQLSKDAFGLFEFKLSAYDELESVIAKYVELLIMRDFVDNEVLTTQTLEEGVWGISSNANLELTRMGLDDSLLETELSIATMLATLAQIALGEVFNRNVALINDNVLPSFRTKDDVFEVYQTNFLSICRTMMRTKLFYKLKGYLEKKSTSFKLQATFSPDRRAKYENEVLALLPSSILQKMEEQLGVSLQLLEDYLGDQFRVSSQLNDVAIVGGAIMERDGDKVMTSAGIKNIKSMTGEATVITTAETNEIDGIEAYKSVHVSVMPYGTTARANGSIESEHPSEQVSQEKERSKKPSIIAIVVAIIGAVGLIGAALINALF